MTPNLLAAAPHSLPTDHHRSLFHCVPLPPLLDIQFTVSVSSVCLLFRHIHPYLPCHPLDKKSRPSFQSIKITLNLDLITNKGTDFNHNTSILRVSSLTHHLVTNPHCPLCIQSSHALHGENEIVFCGLQYHKDRFDIDILRVPIYQC